jgi:hypothetical protein
VHEVKSDKTVCAVSERFCVKHNANLWLLEDCALSCLGDRSAGCCEG